MKTIAHIIAINLKSPTPSSSKSASSHPKAQFTGGSASSNPVLGWMKDSDGGNGSDAFTA